MAEDATEMFARHWRLWTAIFWVATAGLLIQDMWSAIYWFSLGDTDDNMRIMQVRGLLAGQGWFDLRQYRLDPPYGANIHWSRLVDLPIAGIILALKPLMGGAMAEKVAVAIAPLLPMAVAMGAMAAACRRLISPKAFALGVGLLICAHSARGMWTPLRIDHHGWQLALLALAMVALTDPKRARGGVIAGLATAASLAIGLEMLVYLAVVGALFALMWIYDAEERPRFAAYGASLVGGCAFFYLAFTSYANRAPVCDALSPVWLSAMIAAGALAVLLTRLPLVRWTGRLAAAGVAGVVLALAFALAWPHCLGRLEGVSPELDALWLSHVREARPIYTHSWEVIANVVALPIAGLLGYGIMLWRHRRDTTMLIPWAAVAVLATIAAALLLWQTRAGPAAQLLSVPGVTALGWLLIPRAQTISNLVLRVVATVAAFLLISGIGVQYATRVLAKPAPKPMEKVKSANAQCPTLPALRPVALVPMGYVLTFVDLGPRLITVTHHDAVAGPYHRNQQAILDVMRAFRGSADNAHAIIQRRGIDYVLICPGLSESTVYRAEAPKGFYDQLAGGKVPAWLQPIVLPKNSPYRMWRVVKP
jgi:hypothetical protein